MHVSECFFWFQLTQVVLDQGPLNWFCFIICMYIHCVQIEVRPKLKSI